MLDFKETVYEKAVLIGVITREQPADKIEEYLDILRSRARVIFQQDVAEPWKALINQAQYRVEQLGRGAPDYFDTEQDQIDIGTFMDHGQGAFTIFSRQNLVTRQGQVIAKNLNIDDIIIDNQDLLH